MPVTDLPYIDEESLDQKQKSVTFEVPNPDHPEVWHDWDHEMMQDFYKGSEWAVTTLGKDRNAVVGHLMMAIMQSEEHDDDEALVELMCSLLSDRNEQAVRDALLDEY